MSGSPFDDVITRIAFSISANKGVYALLLGSGISRAAGIPTGWEITIDLIRLVARAQGVGEQTDWAAWYRDEVGEEPNYSTLLAQLSSSPEERRAIIHGYIEPTAEERDAGQKVPTVAHRAIARLVEQGYIRVIVTTNFDRLMENALREVGIEPTVVASEDALAGAEPLTHTKCYILKLHGDYKDARILNTDDELGAYPARYDQILDRILDEHGLIISGWSGEWDRALRAAFLRAPNRRYATYWASRAAPKDAAQELIRHRAAQIVTSPDADSFFSGLNQRIETIAQAQQQDPASVDVLVNTAKRYLAKSESRIQLEELFAHEVRALLERLSSLNFGLHGPWSQGEVRQRAARYEAATEAVAGLAGALGRWGNGSEFRIVTDTIQSLFTLGTKDGNGIIGYISLQLYPAVLVFTSYGIGLTHANKWKELHSFLNFELHREHREPKRSVETFFLWEWDSSHEIFKNLEGLDRMKTPLSDHLCRLFSDWARRFIPLAPDFETVFERFEVLASLAHMEREGDETLASLNSGMDQFIRMPIGRACWDGQRARRILAEIRTEPLQSALLEAGFARGKTEILEFFRMNFSRVAGRMNW